MIALLNIQKYFAKTACNQVTWRLVVHELATVLVDAVVGQVDEVVLDVLRVVAVPLQNNRCLLRIRRNDEFPRGNKFLRRESLHQINFGVWLFHPPTDCPLNV